MRIRREDLKGLILENYFYFLISEAHLTDVALSSIIANFMRNKYKKMTNTAPSILLNMMETAVDDVLKIKQIESTDPLKKRLIDLVIKDLRNTGEIRLKIKEPTDKQIAPTPEPQRKFSLKNILGL